jgi:hypothetical protein
VILAAVGALVAVSAVGATLALRGGGGDAGPPVASANTLVRINPWRNVVSDVIQVGALPSAAAVKGHSAWVYLDAGQVAQVDLGSKRVTHTTAIRGQPVDLGDLAGPVLDADTGGAWIVSADENGRGFLTRVRSGGGTRVSPLTGRPMAVGVGAGAVWVLERDGDRSSVLRIDPDSGRIVGRIALGARSRADMLRVGLGAVWAVSSATGVLYRVDGASGAVHREDLGRRAARPDFVLTPSNVLSARGGDRLETAVWVGISDFGGSTAVVDRRGRSAGLFPCCPIDEGGTGVNVRGWPFTYDAATGMVVHWRRGGPGILGRIRVTDAPYWGGLCMTSLAAGAGAIWVTVSGAPLESSKPGCTTLS